MNTVYDTLHAKGVNTWGFTLVVLLVYNITNGHSCMFGQFIRTFRRNKVVSALGTFILSLWTWLFSLAPQETAKVFFGEVSPYYLIYGGNVVTID